MARADSASSMNKIFTNHESKYFLENQKNKKHFDEYFFDPLKQTIEDGRKWETLESAEKYIDEQSWICKPNIAKIDERPNGLEDRFTVEWEFSINPSDMTLEKKTLFLFSILQIRGRVLNIWPRHNFLSWFIAS